ncbi:MAG TPA: HAMP domain-containing sensor histidine kinase, partial [Coleofasciculaceae cyanobacterium]
NQRRLWTIEELSFVKLAAAQLSTAIIQTHTLQQIQSVVQERTAQLQRSLEVQAKLYEKSRQQVEQLRRLNEEREEFLSTVSHELRTPLTSMTLAIRMLRQANLTPERQNKYLNILEQQCAQETNLINDLLALRKLESSQVNHQLQKTDIRYLIQGAAQSIAESWVDKHLTLNLNLPDDPVVVYVDPDSLNRVLLELLTNARKYSDPGTSVELKLTRTIGDSGRQVVLSLQNIGDGISPEELPHIFEKFRRGEGMTQRAIQGTGLGLALVKGLVEHLNGAIDVTSEPQASGSAWETCFILTLPYYPEGVGSVPLSGLDSFA